LSITYPSNRCWFGISAIVGWDRNRLRNPLSHHVPNSNILNFYRTDTEVELKGAKEQIEVIESELEKEKVAIKGQDTTFKINFKQSYLEKPTVQWFFNSKSVITSERVNLPKFLGYGLRNCVCIRRNFSCGHNIVGYPS